MRVVPYCQCNGCYYADKRSDAVAAPHLDRLLQRAASHTHPIEAVILYATWMEHWLNAVLLTTMLRQNMTLEGALHLIRQANIDPSSVLCGGSSSCLGFLRTMSSESNF